MPDIRFINLHGPDWGIESKHLSSGEYYAPAWMQRDSFTFEKQSGNVLTYELPFFSYIHKCSISDRHRDKRFLYLNEKESQNDTCRAIEGI